MQNTSFLVLLNLGYPGTNSKTRNDYLFKGLESSVQGLENKTPVTYKRDIDYRSISYITPNRHNRK